ncbi:MAG: long-chain fatty acid--CoA ligase [Deltaproteobacteria bacterium]|jgi:long-chain acyl-CoA synthetase|nr:long-chain fatty acid--CoA ligase [Deltaproteobacteria bacterium]MBW2535156.1 long-chain fatty acid--CoA ligase [Deltaproteobacteria bacterium]
MGATLVEELLQRAKEMPDGPALRTKRQGRWETTTWAEWLERSRRVAAGLCELGLDPGGRVALAASTQRDWVVADLGVWLAGGISATIHPSAAPEQAQTMITDAGARFVVTDDDRHARALLGSTPEGTVILLADDEPPLDADAAESEAHPGRITLAALERRGADALAQPAVRKELAARAAALSEQDVATIVYSSGTSGEPKGVCLTHGSLHFEVQAIASALRLGPDDEQLLFLPLSHIFGRMLVLVAVGVGAVTSFAEGIGRVLDNMAEVRPTLFASVPRLFEKIYAVSHQTAEYDGPIKQRLVRWAERVAESVARAEYGGKRVPRATALQHRYADRLYLSRVRERFGGRLRFAISGGAPLGADLAQWFYAAGILILEVYGLTECCGGATINRPERFAFGSVGQALPGVDVRIGEGGEVQIRGPNVMRGYWRRPAETTAALDDQGWLHTGDLGEVRRVRCAARGGRAKDADMLHITGRSKELLVTAGGSNVAPRHIEQLLEESPWISHAVLFGDGRPHLVALVTLDEPNVTRWAEEHGLGEATVAALARNDEVRGLVDTDVELCNQRLARHERILRFAILPDDLSPERGELTDTLKVRRHVVIERYRAVIDALYGQRPSV